MALGAVMAVPMLAQTGLSLWQAYQANKLKQDRPYMPLPAEEIEKLNTARRDYSQIENPYASMLRQQLGANVSQGMDALERGSTSGTDILGGIDKLAGQQQEGILGIGKQNIDYKQQTGKTLANALTDMQNAKQMQWQYNIGQPYERAMASRSAMLGAAQQNAMQALWGTAGAIYGATPNGKTQVGTNGTGVTAMQALGQSDQSLYGNPFNRFVENPDYLNSINNANNPFGITPADWSNPSNLNQGDYIPTPNLY